MLLIATNALFSYLTPVLFEILPRERVAMVVLCMVNFCTEMLTNMISPFLPMYRTAGYQGYGRVSPRIPCFQIGR